MPPGMHTVNTYRARFGFATSLSWAFWCTLVPSVGCAVDVDAPSEQLLQWTVLQSASRSVQPTVVLQLPAPLEPGTFTRRSAFWTAGSLASRSTVEYRPSRLQLSITPDGPLERGLAHELQLQPSLRFADGRPVRVVEPLTLADVDGLPLAQPTANVVAAPDADTVANLLEQRCGQCHNDRPLFSFTPVTLYEPSDSDVSRPRVDPFEPGRSVLLERIIPGFARLSGQPMPPVWSDSESLTLDEVRSIEEWILQGAPR